MRDLADIVYLTNEYELGDFGVGGMSFVDQGLCAVQPIVDRVTVP